MFTFARKEHHMTTWLRDRAGEFLPVGKGPRRHVFQSFAKGIWGVAQGVQAEITMEIHLMCLQLP